MSREIKFRAWEKEPKDDVPHFIYNVVVGANGPHHVLGNSGFMQQMQAEDFVIEQFTGLKDKNGKEIYEGDIVDIRNGVVFLDSMRDRHDGGFGISEVIWGWSGFWARPLNGGPCASMAEFITEKEDCKDVEIIGNIHENPGLFGG